MSITNLRGDLNLIADSSEPQPQYLIEGVPISSSGGAANTIFINAESDFPDQDATTITIDADTAYEIGSPFSTSKTFIMNGGTIFSNTIGSSPLITYTGSGTMFLADKSAGRVRRIAISCPSGTVFESVGDGTTSTAFRFLAEWLLCFDCAKVAQMTDSNAIVINDCQFVNVSGPKGFEFTGTGGLVYNLSRIFIGGLTAGATAVDFSDVLTNEVEITDLITAGDSSATSISGLPSSGNIVAGGIASIRGGNFSAQTTPLQGISVNDVRYEFIDNSGLPNSQTAADAYLLAQTEVTINTQGVFELINGGNWASDVSSRFAVDNDGIILYIGEQPIDIRVSGAVTVEKVGGGADQIESRVAINGVTQPKTGVVTDNPTPTSVPLEGLFLIQPNDTIDVRVANNDSNSNIIVDKANLIINLA